MTKSYQIHHYIEVEISNEAVQHPFIPTKVKNTGRKYRDKMTISQLVQLHTISSHHLVVRYGAVGKGPVYICCI
jgi:hypothetical protein